MMTMTTTNAGVPTAAVKKHQVQHTKPSVTDTQILSWILMTLLTVWIAAIVVFGLPGLYIPALILVPVVWAFLIIFSWG